MGQSSSIRTSGADPAAQADSKKSGYTVESGPYEAIVRGHVEGTRMGQLLVSIPDWSGIVTSKDEGANSNQIVVSYASPFYGRTAGTDSQQLPDSPATSGQSYGMWMVPPDIGCKVLVIFVAGDINRGYWFACVYDTPSHHMVPAIGRDIGGANNVQVDSQLQQYVGSDSNLPVIEYNTALATSYNSDGAENTPRFPHNVQAMTYIQQGLDKDKIRGAISSSSLRESPSNVYGISTPGRKATKTDQNAKNPQAVIFRKGGHQFVMDDGSELDGTDQLMRLRTSGGHQILMNDTEKVLYIASATGQQWLEFSPNGSINIYGAAGFNLRSQGPINMHSDALIAMCAPSIKIDAVMGAKSKGLPSVSITSQGSFSASAITTATLKSDFSLSLSTIGKASLTSGASLSLSSAAMTSLYGTILNIGAKTSVTSINGSLINLNCGSMAKPGIPSPAVPTIPKAHNDAIWSGTGYVVSPTLLSTCLTVPTHEPWQRPAPKKA